MCSLHTVSYTHLDVYKRQVFKGKIWRIGLMGTNSTRRNVITFLGALEDILVSQGAKISAGVALDAASSVYR